MINKDLNIQKFKHSLIKRNDLDNVIKLKKKEWKYSFLSHNKWIAQNLKDNDLHILLLKEKKLIGYNLLRKRRYFNLIEEFEKKRLKKKYYLYFDTFIIDPNYRKKGFAKFFLKKINKIILKQDLFSLLLCKKKHVKFYKSLKWKQTNKKRFKIIDKKTRLNLMYLNRNNMELKNIKIMTN